MAGPEERDPGEADGRHQGRPGDALRGISGRIQENTSSEGYPDKRKLFEAKAVKDVHHPFAVIVVPGRHPGLGAAARLADGVRGIEPVVSGKGLEPFEDARRPGADAGQDDHRGRSLGFRLPRRGCTKRVSTIRL